MLHDLNEPGEFQPDAAYQTCVIGAGAAGITIAQKLAAEGRRVLLLEAGDENITATSQDFYQARTIARSYYDLQTSRLRFFGGTTNHWTGWCRALDQMDFEPRNGIAMSGWPIQANDLRPYYEDAMSILELEDERPFFETDPTTPASNGGLRTISFAHSPPVRFAAKYGEGLAASSSVDVLLNATAVGLEANSETGAFRSVQVRDYQSGNTRSFKANQFVVALGGVENARFLLLLNRELGGLAGNSGDMVGRCFMEHPAFTIGGCVLFNPSQFRVASHYALPQDSLAARSLAQCIVSLEPVGRPPYYKHSGLYGSMRRQTKDIICELGLEEFVRKFANVGACVDYTNEKAVVRAALEQLPNPASRVTLSKETDTFGQPRCELNWELLRSEKRALKAAALEFGMYLARAELGRFKAYDWVLDDEQGFPAFDHDKAFALWHHMGTTRMSVSPETGVVDKDCRVHGTRNLYVAGSSVFATSGLAQPTFTIVALALRLAEHLSRQPD